MAASWANFSGIDADRKYRGARPAVARDDDAVMHGEAEIGLRVRQEVLAILLGLETDQIIGQHRLDQFAMMRHAADITARVGHGVCRKKPIGCVTPRSRNSAPSARK